MSSFSSSVINKSGKKFAPKAPVRRANAPTLTSAPSSRAATSTPAPQILQPLPSPRLSPLPTPPEVPQSPPANSPASIQSSCPDSPATFQFRSLRDIASGPVRILPPERRSSNPIAAPTDTPFPDLAEPLKPTFSGSEIPTAITLPTPRARSSESTKSPSPPRSPIVSLTPPSTDLNTDVRPSKRIRISEPEADTQQLSLSNDRSVTLRDGVSQAAEKPARQSGVNIINNPVSKPKKTRSKRKVAEDSEIADGTDAPLRSKVSRGGRKREETPEDAESVEIVSAVVTMADLCKDLRTGRRSRREMELRNMETAELARKQEAKENKRKACSQDASNEAVKQSDQSDRPQNRETSPTSGPQMRIVNGEIVLDTSTLQIDRHADAARNAEDMEEVVENTLTRRINQATFGKRTKYEPWDEELTDLFYKGLRMFGTDFMMISKMFPSRTRRHIKLKFCNEERKDPERIKMTLLGPREPVNLEAYSEWTNTVYDDPKILERELEEEKTRIEQEHAKEKEAREQQLRNPGDGGVLPSIENGADTKRNRGQKKKATKSAKLGGGTEEILGTIDDI
ncbi:hypothetical protein LOZ12_005307 [Ophidiomyces ophidiicola]|uniref:Uncharacterized protein n=1 Tax=Ophidiomyces ophidiicola TaxID=1387563 RepID=A0ACB8UPH3_9EURO|nr:hypothetical protein LOZ64_005709 [Ophidiomyces ophidiicola]KAI1911300.1 hypothetical protein LOZ61_003964 [Ophidiomyces ophidiicola]KAI1923107.1 hypothetical protein LOZ60_005419 [Ophidiomyces ophidiicola]KAI1936132.1 hypothetical protein LOZ62_005794 [Ophidiomyces ophidiicola]KAI1953225.1 hypothetical protein LOZ59_005202 [Ophidiomyces ophidiicola]